jgi:uncharacterized protein (TIGR02118 family)
MCHRPFLIVKATLEPTAVDAFRRWYQEVHLPHMMRIPGIEDAYHLRRGDVANGHMAVFSFASDEAVRTALASNEAQQARADWVPWMRDVSDLSVEIYADLTPLPAYRHWN